MAPVNPILLKIVMKKSNKHPVAKLQGDQKKIFAKLISNLFSPTSQVVLLDAPPGTGKSFLITTFVHNISLSHEVIVTQKHLIHDFEAEEVKAGNIYNYLKELIAFQGSDVIASCDRLFADKATLEECLVKMYNSIMKIRIESDVLILDEYHIVSPWMLMCLVYAAKRLGKHLILSGDGNQMNSLHPSRYHQGMGNRELAMAMADHSFTLQEQIRTMSEYYLPILNNIRTKFENNNEPRIKFDLLYYIYEQLSDKFFEHPLEAIYLSDDQEILKKRQEEIVRQWKKEKLTIYYEHYKFRYRLKNAPKPDPNDYYYNLYFRNHLYEDESSDYEETEDEWIDFKGEHKEFPTVLPLVLGATYIYEDELVVRLIAIGEHSLQVKDCATNKQYRVVRRNIKKCYLPADMVKWLNSECDKAHCYCVSGYPLKLPLTNYQTLQGRTIKNHKIVLNVDNAEPKKIYMALSRVTSYGKLGGIQSSLLPSLYYTANINMDEYYYKIHSPKFKINDGKFNCLQVGQMHGIKVAKIPTLQSVEEFEGNTKTNCRILKSAYNDREGVSTSSSPPPSGILKISKFFSSHPVLLQKVCEEKMLLEHFRKFIQSRPEQGNNVKEPEEKRAKVNK